MWGYVKGGMGVMLSFAIAEAAEEAGAVLACGVPVAEIIPGEGVRLEGGDLIRTTTVVCNADPKRALGMLGVSEAVPEPYRIAARGVADPQPRREVQRGAVPAPDVHGRGGRAVAVPLDDLGDARDSTPRSAAFADCARRPRRTSGSARCTSRPATTRRPRPRAST